MKVYAESYVREDGKVRAVRVSSKWSREVTDSWALRSVLGVAYYWNHETGKWEHYQLFQNAPPKKMLTEKECLDLLPIIDPVTVHSAVDCR